MGEPTLAQRLSSMAVQAVPALALPTAAEALLLAKALVALAEEGGPLIEEGEATVIGTEGRMSAPGAALANAASAVRAAGTEPGQWRWSGWAIPVVAAAIAVAETVDASGAELLGAIAAGLEVTLRVRAGVGQSMAANGWDVTAALGGLGAAVAAGRLLGLDRSALTAAIGIASTRAAGFSRARGTDVASFQVGKGAADGIEAARLAGRGFTAPATSIEGRRGLGHLLADQPSYAAITAGLGEQWLIAPPEDDALRRACLGLPAASGLSGLLAEARQPESSQRRVPHSPEKA